MSDSAIVVLSLVGLVLWGGFWALVGVVASWFQPKADAEPFELRQRDGGSNG